MEICRKTLSEFFAQPLHVRPLIQCVCGTVLSDVLCEDLYCAGHHAPPEVWRGCRICAGRSRGTSVPQRREEST